MYIWRISETIAIHTPYMCSTFHILINRSREISMSAMAQVGDLALSGWSPRRGNHAGIRRPILISTIIAYESLTRPYIIWAPLSLLLPTPQNLHGGHDWLCIWQHLTLTSTFVHHASWRLPEIQANKCNGKQPAEIQYAKRTHDWNYTGRWYKKGKERVSWVVRLIQLFLRIAS